jgi:hypothetical protein
MSNKLPPDIPPPCGDYGIKLPRTYYPDNMNKEYLDVLDKSSNNTEDKIFRPKQFMSLENFEYMKNFAKTFTIYKWITDAELHSDGEMSGSAITQGAAYVPWIRFTGSKFEILKTYKLHVSESLLPMHWWIKDLDHLQEWLGDEQYSKIVTYVLMDNINTKKKKEK